MFFLKSVKYALFHPRWHYLLVILICLGSVLVGDDVVVQRGAKVGVPGSVNMKMMSWVVPLGSSPG